VIRIAGGRYIGAARAAGRYPEGTDPALGAPEIAFAGRSNVGKSSLINTLVARRGLARTSSTPGRTRQLNFYAVEIGRDPVILVDLPGYGYARGSEDERRAWRPLVEGYLEGRRTLAAVVLIVDVRRGLEAEEAQLLEYLGAHRLPAVVAVTKIDKIGRGQRPAALRPIGAAAAALAAVGVVGVSAKTGEGREALWRRLFAPPISLLGGRAADG
jgi:GTP-binding protein